MRPHLPAYFVLHASPFPLLLAQAITPAKARAASAARMHHARLPGIVRTPRADIMAAPSLGNERRC
jgi:hypothetical protein